MKIKLLDDNRGVGKMMVYEAWQAVAIEKPRWSVPIHYYLPFSL